MQKNVKDLEKTLDLDSVQQVIFKPPHPVREGTSATTTTPTTHAPSTAAPGTDKGKGIMGVEEETLKEQPASSIGQQQEHTPPPQTEPPVAPIL